MRSAVDDLFKLSGFFSADCTCSIGHYQIGPTAFSANDRQSKWCVRAISFLHAASQGLAREATLSYDQTKKLQPNQQADIGLSGEATLSFHQTLIQKANIGLAGEATLSFHQTLTQQANVGLAGEATLSYA